MILNTIQNPDTISKLDSLFVIKNGYCYNLANFLFFRIEEETDILRIRKNRFRTKKEEIVSGYRLIGHYSHISDAERVHTYFYCKPEIVIKKFDDLDQAQEYLYRIIQTIDGVYLN